MISTVRLKIASDAASVAETFIVGPQEPDFAEGFGALLARRGLVDAAGLLRARISRARRACRSRS